MSDLEVNTLNKSIDKILKWLVFLVVFIYFLFFFYGSMFNLVKLTFSQNLDIKLTDIINLVKEIRNLEAIVFSFMQGVFGTLICLGLGIPISYLLYKYRFFGSKFVIYVLSIPFMLPASVIIFAFTLSFGVVYGNFHFILLIHVFSYFAISLWFGILAWKNVNNEQVLMAKSLGASKWKRFRTIIFPQVIPYFLSSSVIIFAYCMNSYEVVMALGSIKLESIEVRIFKEIIFNLNYSDALILTFLQMILNFFIIILFLLLEKKRKINSLRSNQGLSKIALFSLKEPKKVIKDSFVILPLILIAISFLLPILKLIITSFQPITSGASFFSGYKQIFFNGNQESNFILMLANTFLVSFLNVALSSLIALFVVLIIKEPQKNQSSFLRKLSNNLFTFLYTFPITKITITIAFGFVLLVQNMEFFTHGHNSWLLIVITQSIISIPIIIRFILDAYHHIDKEYIEIAQVYGASQLQIFLEIELPQLKRGIMHGIIFSFIISISEMGTTMFITRNNFPTLALEILNSIYDKNLQLTASISVFFIIIAIIVSILFEINQNAKYQKTI